MNVISRMTSDYQQRSSEQQSSSVKNTPPHIKPTKSGNRIRSPYILAGTLSLAIIGLSVYYWIGIPQEQHKFQQTVPSPTKNHENSQRDNNNFKDISVLTGKTNTNSNSQKNFSTENQQTKKLTGKTSETVKTLAQKETSSTNLAPERKSTPKPPIKKTPATVTKRPISKVHTAAPPMAPEPSAKPHATLQDKAKTKAPRKLNPIAKSHTNQDDDQGEMRKTMNTASNPQLAQQTFVAAIKLLKRKEFKKTEEYLNTALEFDPQHVQARETLAGIFIGKRQNDKAITILTEGVNQTPDYFKFRLLLAQTYIDINNEGQALTTLLDAPEELKTTGQYHSMIAVIQQNLGMYKDAIHSYQQALKIQPNESRWWLGIGLTYEYDEQYKQAEQAYLRASQIGNLGRDILRYIDTRLRSVRLHTNSH